MNERTALEIADKLDFWIRSVMGIPNVPTLPKLCECGNDASDMLRQQYDKIERLKDVPMKYRRMAFNAQLQEENAQLSKKIDLLTADKETLVHNANRAFYAMQGQQEEIDRLTKERDTAIAASVAAEQEACIRICKTSLSREEAEYLIRARSVK